MSGRLIGHKSWNRRVEIFLEFLRPICAVRSSFRDYFGCCLMIYYINYVLASRRPEMGMEFGSTERN